MLVAQHFQCGFAKNGEIDRGFLRGGIGENDLMRQRGLAATRRTSDDIEGELWQPSANNFIEAANAGEKLADVHPLGCAADI